MAGITTRSSTSTAVLNPIEGTTIWNTTNLTYAFATTAHQAQVTGEITSARTGTFNAIDTETNYRDAVLGSFAAYERVSNLNFTAAANFNSADIKIAGIDNYARGTISLAGTMDFPGNNPMPGSSTNFQSYLLLNTTTFLGAAAEPGGANALMYVTNHEIGHGLGLAHPQDTANGSTQVGSSDATDSPERPLDNERYTVLSYETGGLDKTLRGPFGHSASPSALDIAAIQAMYGANPNTNNTITTYRLVDLKTGALDVDGNDGTVEIGRAFFSIWDTGGTDRIIYSGSKRVLLNLNDATLSTTDDAETQKWIEQVTLAKHYSQLPSEFKNDLEDPNYHAGGFFSRVFVNSTAKGYDLGGYSIANGVRIENATASDGNDFLIGNELSNILVGNGGEDFLHGANAADYLEGGDGNDELQGGGGDDTLDGGAGDDLAIYSGNCSEYDMTRDEATGAITIAHARGDMSDGSDTLQKIFVRSL